jgi:hypothetical protein
MAHLLDELMMGSLKPMTLGKHSMTVEEAQKAFHESNEREITAAIETLRQTLRDEHQQHIKELFKPAISGS